jgi:hypothetical protein
LTNSQSRSIRLLFGASAALVLIAGVLLVRDWSLSSGADTVEGVVVELDAKLSGNHFVYAPVVSFETNRESRRMTGDIATFPAAYRIGDRIDLLVDREDPSRVVIDSYRERHSTPVLLLGLGALASLIGTVTLVRARRG